MAFIWATVNESLKCEWMLGTVVFEHCTILWCYTWPSIFLIYSSIDTCSVNLNVCLAFRHKDFSEPFMFISSGASLVLNLAHFMWHAWYLDLIHTVYCCHCSRHRPACQTGGSWGDCIFLKTQIMRMVQCLVQNLYSQYLC